MKQAVGNPHRDSWQEPGPGLDTRQKEAKLQSNNKSAGGKICKFCNKSQTFCPEFEWGHLPPIGGGGSLGGFWPGATYASSRAERRRLPASRQSDAVPQPMGRPAWLPVPRIRFPAPSPLPSPSPSPVRLRGPSSPSPCPSHLLDAEWRVQFTPPLGRGLFTIHPIPGLVPGGDQGGSCPPAVFPLPWTPTKTNVSLLSSHQKGCRWWQILRLGGCQPVVQLKFLALFFAEFPYFLIDCSFAFSNWLPSPPAPNSGQWTPVRGLPAPFFMQSDFQPLNLTPPLGFVK